MEVMLVMNMPCLVLIMCTKFCVGRVHAKYSVDYSCQM